MFYKEVVDYNDILQRIEEKDDNYRENPKWQYYRRQQDLIYLAKAKQELNQLRIKVDANNKRIKFLEDYIENHRHILEVKDVEENKKDS